MKITKTLVKQFELEQEECGTEVAIYNLLWQVAAEILNDLGLSKIRTK